MARSGWVAPMLAVALAAAGAAAVQASDDDEDPPYLIYIDPETGRYTTIDPQAAVADERERAARRTASAPGRKSGRTDSELSWAAASGAAVAAAFLVLAGGGLLRWRRRRTTVARRRLDNPI